MAARLLLRSLRRGSSSPATHLARGLLHRSPSPSPGVLRRWFFQGSQSAQSKPPRRLRLGAVANAVSASFVCASAAPFFNQKSLATLHGSNMEKRQWTDDIIAANLLVYVADIALKRKLTMWGAKVNSLISKGQIWRLATPALLHGPLYHITLNTLSLASIGPKVEEVVGPRRFLAIYFTSAISGSLMSYWFSSAHGIGASGAICGLVGAQAVYLWRHQDLFGNAKENLDNIKFVILLNLGIGLLCRRLDNWAHLGGLLGGAAIEWFYGPDWKGRPLFGQ
uniref:Peptidase S54 rhomboid domain-containing protein n=1 Tax=Hordeum vulgare subsp. vulgare TaxID=112509 RepID=A0A8I6XSQ8_HORVV